MRGRVFSVSVVCLVLGLSATTRADDEFMRECLVTNSRTMCECMSANVPPDQRAAAIAGLRKSNAAVAPGGAMADPSTMSHEQIQGMQAVVTAQAACM